MERISAAVCTLEERRLSFRADNEQFGFPSNDNYLNLLELAAKFDPFLLDHISRYGNSDQETSLIGQKLFAKRLFNSTPKKLRSQMYLT